jgi:hypothetical protein
VLNNFRDRQLFEAGQFRRFDRTRMEELQRFSGRPGTRRGTSDGVDKATAQCPILVAPSTL